MANPDSPDETATFYAAVAKRPNARDCKSFSVMDAVGSNPTRCLDVFRVINGKSRDTEKDKTY
jgi:hypothetical protein